MFVKKETTVYTRNFKRNNIYLFQVEFMAFKICRNRQMSCELKYPFWIDVTVKKRLKMTKTVDC